MDVCQFFLKGICKFGSQCRNLHPQGPGGINQRPTFGGFNKSSLQLTGGQSANNSWTNNRSNNSNNNQDLKEKTILNIKSDMQTWETSGMWPFSCFSFQKEKPCISGLTDYSPEEMRLEAYNAKASNNIDKYVTSLQQCSEQLKRRRTELKNLNASTLEKEERLMTGASTNLFQNKSQISNPFSSNPSFPNSVNQPRPSGLFSTNSSGSGQSLFGQKTGQSIFQQPSNLDSQTSKSNFPSQNPFGSSTAMPLFGQSTKTQGLFSQMSQSIAQNSFTQQTTQPTNQGLFSQTNNKTSSGLFSQQATSNSSQPGLFNQPAQGLFGTAGMTQNNTNQQQPGTIGQQSLNSLFGNREVSGNAMQSNSAANSTQNANPFLQAAMQQQAQSSQSSQVAPQIESTLKMTEKDLAAFKAESFVYGQIPECPPPPELC